MTSIEEAVYRIAGSDPSSDGGSFAAIPHDDMKAAITVLQRESTDVLPCDMCSESVPGVTFTQAPDQDITDADNVQRCDGCSIYPGDLEAARALALRLLADVSEGDLNPHTRMAWTNIVSIHDANGDLYGGSGAIALRFEVPEACMYGEEFVPPGGHYRIESVGLHHPEPTPEPTPEPFRIHPEDEARAAGLFEAIVASARLYCEILGADEQDATGTLLQGLVENLDMDA